MRILEEKISYIIDKIGIEGYESAIRAMGLEVYDSEFNDAMVEDGFIFPEESYKKLDEGLDNIINMIGDNND